VISQFHYIITFKTFEGQLKLYNLHQGKIYTNIHYDIECVYCDLNNITEVETVLIVWSSVSLNKCLSFTMNGRHTFILRACIQRQKARSSRKNIESISYEIFVAIVQDRQVLTKRQIQKKTALIQKGGFSRPIFTRIYCVLVYKPC
jgi:hypothetical protein